MVDPGAWSAAVMALSGVNTAALLVTIWKGGRWTGLVDARLRALESSVARVMGKLNGEKDHG